MTNSKADYKTFVSPDGSKKIEIWYDGDAESPRAWDNIGKMICFHNRYTLGDKHEFDDPGEVKRSEYFDESKYFRFPLHLLDHSGCTMSIGSFGPGFEWDSGPVGWIFIPVNIDPAYVADGADLVRTCEMAHKIAQAEVETYADYLEGNVFIVDLKVAKRCDCCGHVEWIDEDSCCGFIGIDSAMELAKEFAGNSLEGWTEE